jgi:outer membrane protein TolC
MLTAEATLLQARSALAAVISANAQQRIILLLTVGGSFEPDQAALSLQIAKDVSHD